MRRKSDLIIKVLSLGVGMAIAVILIAKVCFELSYDNVYKDIDRIYKIRTGAVMQGEDKDFGQVSGAIAPGFKAEVPGVLEATRFTSIFNSENFIIDDDGSKVAAEHLLADSCFFRIFNRQFLAGEPEKALRSWSGDVAISKTFAEKLGGVGAAVGKQIANEDNPNLKLTVCGVYEDFPKNESIHADVILSIEAMSKWSLSNWVGNDRYVAFVKLAEGVDPASLKDALALKDLFPGEEAFCPEKVLLDNNKDMKNKSGQMEDSVTTDESMKQTISCKKSVFDIEHLKFQYLENVPVLQDINLTIDHRPTAVIGQNGAGKTTLVKLLKGLLKPVGGSIYYGGSDMAEKTVAMLAGEIGYVFQNPDDQIFKYHVIDEVMFGPQNIGMTKEQAKEKAVAALKLVGLEQLADENPYDLELSERKLVAIASVLAMDTKVLILDEPTIAQDWKGRKIIQKMIRDLSSQGKTVIAILHDMDFVAESFERVIVMAHGKVLADGTKEEVFAQKDVLEQARIDQPYLTKLCQQLGYKNLYFSLKD